MWINESRTNPFGFPSNKLDFVLKANTGEINFIDLHRIEAWRNGMHCTLSVPCFGPLIRALQARSISI
jgi:hypothetical protein